jgi:hypothetical protein
MKPMNRVEKKKSSYALIKILATTPKAIQFGAFAQELLEGKLCARVLERLVSL